MILKKEFYFVRHGQTNHNAGLPSDEVDISINQVGQQQAQAIQSLIANLPIKSVCHSPMKRAKQTKEIIASTLAAEHYEIKELHECSDELWEKMIADEKPNLESSQFRNFLQQVRDGINQALAKEGPVLIVAHGGIHWAVCCLMNVEHEWIIDNCLPVHFSLQDDRWVAKKLI
jgi:probable phosphoglycerate mutase